MNGDLSPTLPAPSPPLPSLIPSLSDSTRKKSLWCWCPVVGRAIAPKDAHACAYVTSSGKRDFAGVMKDTPLRWAASGLHRQDLSHHTSPRYLSSCLAAEAQKDGSMSRSGGLWLALRSRTCTRTRVVPRGHAARKCRLQPRGTEFCQH